MTGWAPRVARERALAELDRQVAAAPEGVELRFRRAGCLAALGRTEEAKHDYLGVLARAPTHFGALNDLGTLLYDSGYRTAARTAYAEAVARHPDNPLGHINLANLLLAASEMIEARHHYETALRLAPDHTEAHRGLANLLTELGESDAAERHRRRAFTGNAVTTLPYRGAGRPVSVLVPISGVGGNIPTRPLLDDRVFQASMLVPEYHDAEAPLPPHDLVFNAIGDADLCRPALAAAIRLIARTTAPVLNRPEAVLATGRAENAKRLAPIPGVVAPRVSIFPRAHLVSSDGAAVLMAQGFAFPLLLRTPGFHTGRHFLRVDGPGDVAAAAASLPGEHVAAIEFLDARSPDGTVRKYRVMMIDGALYPLHLAIATRWKVHYFTADMEADATHRAEEAEFLADMDAVLGPAAVAALTKIQKTLGLDYAGIDFGLGPKREILLFEANATMVINPPLADDAHGAYRRAPVERALTAVRTMLTRRRGC